MSQTIAFNADDRQKVLVEVLAKRLGFRNVSDMLRAWIEGGISEHISAEEQEQILSFYKPTGIKKQLQKFHADESTGVPLPKERSARQARK